jgi:broad specificity phosphatase PhoE
MLVTVMRHAESMGNAGFGGGVDPGLSPKGTLQAARAAERLAKEGVTHVWSSPFRRAILTARATAAPQGIEVVLHHEMCEHYIYDDFLGWTCPLGKDIAGAHEGVRLADGFPDGLWTPAWGEPWDAICARTANVARRAIDLGRSRPRQEAHLLIVGHGASVKAVLRSLAGLDIAQAEPYVNAGVSRIRLDSRLPGEALFLNDASHLSGL